MSQSNSLYKKIKPLTFVSVEGFWKKNIHDQRISEAVPGVRKINSQYNEGAGYHFVLSFL